MDTIDEKEVEITRVSTRKIARLTDLPIEHVQAVFETLFRCLNRGLSVNIRGFGTFKRVVHNGRTQRTGLAVIGTVTYQDKYLIKFYPGRTLKERINRIPPGYVPKKTRKKNRKLIR